MRRFFRALSIFACGCLGFLALGTTAAAQPSVTGGAYVSGSLIGEIKRFSGDVEDPLFNGETFGGAVAIGTSVHPRWDLELCVGVPRFTATSRERHVTLQRSVITLESVTENQTLSVAALARLHGAARGRVQVGYLAGLSVVRFRRNSHTDAPADTPSALIPSPDQSVGYAAAPTLGIDARVAVSSRLAIVPGLHAMVFSLKEASGVLLRPRVSLRLTF